MIKKTLVKVIISIIILILVILNISQFVKTDDKVFLNNSESGIGIKSKNPLLIYTFKPNYNDDKYGYKLNSFGFRDDDFQIKKKNKTFRIAIIGDSVTFGVYVNNSKYIASEKLEAYLNNNSNTSLINYEVYNFGVSGYSLFQERILLNETVIKFNPDLIIIQYILNDIDEEYMFSIKQWFTKEDYLKRLKLKQDLEDQSLYCRLKQWSKNTKGYLVLKETFSKEEPNIFLLWKNIWENIYDDKCKIKSIETNLKEIKKTASNTPIIIVNSPFLLWNNDTYYEENITKKIQTISENNNFLFLDLTNNYMKYNIDMIKLKENPTDKDHPNRFGHDITARTIYNFFIEKKLIPNSTNIQPKTI